MATRYSADGGRRKNRRTSRSPERHFRGKRKRLKKERRIIKRNGVVHLPVRLHIRPATAVISANWRASVADSAFRMPLEHSTSKLPVSQVRRALLTSAIYQNLPNLYLLHFFFFLFIPKFLPIFLYRFCILIMFFADFSTDFFSNLVFFFLCKTLY